MSDPPNDTAGVENSLGGASQPGVGSVAAARAGIWSAVDLIGRQAVTLVVSIILARLLTPTDFGAVAMAVFFATFFTALVQNGLSTAVIQRHEASDDELSSIFWWSLILSIALAALLVAVGPMIARFFALAVLAPLMIAAAAQIVLTGFGAVHLALLTRDLRFGAIARAGIPATALSGVIGVVLALSGAGVWALAAQLVSAAALNSFALWLASGWRPAAVLRSDGFIDALRFARWVSLSAGLEVLYTQGSALILGKLYGPRDLGLYVRASSTQQLPANVVTGIIARVVLPLLTRRRGDTEAMRRGLLSANRMAMIITLPALAGLALTADLAIRVLYGPQWMEASPALAILAWAGVLYPLHANNLQLLLASGRSDTYFSVETVKKVVGIVSVVIGSRFGIIGLAWSQLAFSVIALLINTWPSRRYLRCGIVAQLSDLRGVIAATAIMGASVLALRQVMNAGPLAELCACVLVGAATYLIAGLLFRVDAFGEAIAISRSLRKSQASA